MTEEAMAAGKTSIVQAQAASGPHLHEDDTVDDSMDAATPAAERYIAPEALITTDIEGIVTWLNALAARLTGWREEEACGRPLHDVFRLIDESRDDAPSDPVAAILAGHAPEPASRPALLRRNGSRMPVRQSTAPILGAQRRLLGALVVFHDMSVAQDMAAKMSYQATHDGLTGLINRREFERRLELALQSAQAQQATHTLLYLDLDQFKVINDTCGHGAGDALLRQFAAVMRGKLRQSDTLARLGGDEFGVLLENCGGKAALRVADSLRQTARDFHFIWDERVFPIGVSIGQVSFGDAGLSLPDLLRMADSACYVAKDKGRNRVHIYAPDDKELERREGEMGWVGRIQKALNEQRFVLYSQRIASLDENDGDEEHYEVLLRMQDEHGKLVSPMAFIPAAERYGLMPQLDRWVIATALRAYPQHHRAGGSRTLCSINLSGTTICDDSFLDFLRAEFRKHKVPPQRICFEITETSAIANLAQATALIQELKAMGCRFSLDDFGSGMSSFAYLKHLPVDYLKIDGGFVKDIAHDPIDQAMVESINRIGHVMGIRTIAEFVENDTILNVLRGIGVDYAQGYGVQKPVPISSFPIASKLALQ